MGRSIAKPTVDISGRLYHKASDSTIVIRSRGPEMEHRVERRGLSASYPVAYSMGAGLVGYSYLVRIGDYLFQSPASFYTRTNNWDLTPGFEAKKHLDFTRQISGACLFCHTGSLHLVAGTNNRFEEPAFTPISCERCHGSARRHLLNPGPGSIVNPRTLPERARDSVCEQCHLEGVVRVLNPGRDWWDYKPGDQLEKTIVTYLEDAGSTTLRAVGHSEQLAQSRCARASRGRLWCGTCHDPHASKNNRPAQVREVCLSCHETIFAAAKHVPATECVTCHMPRLRPSDIAHSAVTDHRILRKPMPDTPREPAVNLGLRAWREPDSTLAQRDLGLAYFDWTASQPDPDKLTRTYDLLSHLASGGPDPPVLADLASILLQQGQFNLSAQLFAKAAQADPMNARYAYCVGVARERAGDVASAMKELRRSITLDPSQPDPYLALARIYAALGQESRKLATLREYLRFMPQNLTLRSND